MKRIIIFLVLLYLISALGVWAFFSKSASTTASLSKELSATKNEIAIVKSSLDAEKVARVMFEDKVSHARANATFLSLALCPTLEATNKEAPCIKNSTEWLSETLVSGTALTSPDTKEKMDALLVALSKKVKPTAKQLYEMLKPIEVSSLKALVENLE
ncbi:MAG: hypothetical protein Q7K40_05575 [bacterium]|nr:hypothetical protein [bacterium]